MDKMLKRCLVINCGSRSDRDKDLRFFPIPTVQNSSITPRAEISRKRREFWLEAIGRGSMSEATIKNGRVCSKHFIRGFPTRLTDDDDPDWVPSLHMGFTSTGLKPEDFIDLQQEETEEHLRNIPEANMNLNNIETVRDSDNSDTEEHSPFAESIFDTLRDIQENNPQVEAVFIEEEDDAKGSSLYDPKSPFHSESSDDVQFIKEEIAPAFKPVAPSDYITVKAMSPSQMNPSIMQQGHTIVLQDGTQNNSKSTKLLVIPKDVIPVLAKTKGPLAINVPGIGPLLIPKPADMFQSTQKTLNQPIIQTTVIEKKPKVLRYEPLRDPKFFCWLYRAHLKRDLDGFSMKDRLGFYKREQERCRMCVTKLRGAISKLEKSIAESKHRLVDIRYKNSSFKLVDINSIKAEPKTFVRKRYARKKHLEFEQLRREHVLESRYSSTDSEDGLLVTKKVVPLHDDLRNNEPQVVSRRGRGGRFNTLKYPPVKVEVTVRHQRQRGRPRKRGRGRWNSVTVKEEAHSFHKDPLLSAFKETTFHVIDNLRQFQQELDPGNLGPPELVKFIKFVTPDVLGRHLGGATEVYLCWLPYSNERNG
ncbi:uncharacterized protein LOC126743557 isoform X2 [Anthonomus grandis grandis]|uniref:uncharacterized protein LOC126743557 isoform X2 n=1 Tax=Anthonomus grandis grandis TaxID=2921223 RepID=UPI00216542B3|nr:uncharacterized protein LOC126743557 isoform X2 [Anthonomus grandis grandis]